MSKVKLLGRTPFRALLVEEVELNRFRLSLWGVRWGQFTLPPSCADLKSLASVTAVALSIHRRIGVPLAVQRCGEPVRPFRCGEFW